MKLSNSLNGFPVDYPQTLAISRCQAAGFTALDLNYWDHQKRLSALSWQEEERWAYGLRDAADRVGIPFTQMHGPVHGTAFQSLVPGLELDAFVELLKRSLRTAAIIGTPWIVLHPSNISPRGGETYREVTEYNVHFFRQLIPSLETTGVGIALENSYDTHQRKYCALPDELIELVDRLDHPLIGACLDTGHAHKQGIRPSAFIAQLGPRLKTTHIQDGDGKQDQHVLPYLGTIDWPDTVNALRGIQYMGDFTYETHRSFITLPDTMKDAALRYAVELGSWLLAQTPESGKMQAAAKSGIQ